MTTNHNIVIQSWGHRPVVICLAPQCVTEESPNGLQLVPGRRTTIPFSDVAAAIEQHTGEGAFRAGGTYVEDQIRFVVSAEEGAPTPEGPR